MSVADALGWVATFVFTASYVCRDASAMRRVQAVGALLWTSYAVALRAPPVIVANLLVLVAIAMAMAREPRQPEHPAGSPSE